MPVLGLGSWWYDGDGAVSASRRGGDGQEDQAAARNSDLASGEVVVGEQGEFHILDLLDVELVEVATPSSDPTDS